MRGTGRLLLALLILGGGLAFAAPTAPPARATVPRVVLAEMFTATW